MRLLQLELTGLKRRDATYQFGAVNVIKGPNGAGKSAVLQALALLARGDAPGLGSSAAAIIRLARDERLVVRALFERDGRQLTATRSWTRQSNGSVKEAIEGTLFEGDGSMKARAGQLLGTLGGFVHAWAPEDLLGLSSDKLRRELIRVLAGDDLSPKALAPKDLPIWAQPKDGDSIEIWLKRAVTDIAGSISEHQASAKALEEQAMTFPINMTPVLDQTPIRERLAALRQEYARAEAASQQRGRLATARSVLEALRARMGNPGPSVETARAALSSAEHGAAQARFRAKREQSHAETQAKASAARKSAQAAEAKAADVAQRLTERWGADADAGSEAELNAAKERHDRLTWEMAAGLRDTGNREVAAELLAKLELEHCPECGCLLDRHVLRVIESQEAARAAGRAQLQAQIDEAHAAYVREIVRNELAIALSVATQAQQSLVEADARVAEIASELAQLPETAPVEDLARLQAALRDAEDRARAKDQADRKAVEVRRLEAELDDEAPSRAVEAILSDLQVAESDLAALARQAERTEQRTRAREHAESEREGIAEMKALRDRLKSIEADVLERLKARLEAPLSEVTGKRCLVELVDGKGNPACRFSVGGVDVSTLSDGERLSFVAALIRALGAQARAAYRPLLLDRFEAVSADRRAGFLTAVVAAVREGALDQAIVAGTPDTVPAVDGVTVIELAADDASRGVAA